jgi:MOSC domain-containing protein YiiM
METGAVDSSTMGEPARFRKLAELESCLRALPESPRDVGRVALLVRRGEGGRRETPLEVRLTTADGVPGDAWSRRAARHVGAQISAMQADVAALLANGQPLTLSGDNLLLELDLSTSNLPPGSRVRAGDALLEVTSQPHNGCAKFRARFGADALRFVSRPDLRPRNLRGVYLRVVEAGTLRLGDAVEVLARYSSSS